MAISATETDREATDMETRLRPQETWTVNHLTWPKKMVRGPPVFLNVKLRNSSLEQFSRKSNFHSQILFGESSNGIKWLQVIPDQRLHKDMVYACVCYVHVICACIWGHKNDPVNPTHVGLGLMHPHDGRYSKCMRNV